MYIFELRTSIWSDVFIRLILFSLIQILFLSFLNYLPISQIILDPWTITYQDDLPTLLWQVSTPFVLETTLNALNSDSYGGLRNYFLKHLFILTISDICSSISHHLETWIQISFWCFQTEPHGLTLFVSEQPFSLIIQQTNLSTQMSRKRWLPIRRY